MKQVLAIRIWSFALFLSMTSSIPQLTFPAQDEPGQASSSAITLDGARTLHSDKLYIGNLHPAVDEHSLLKLLIPFGTVIALDFLFHTSGPKKGTPRGYAFVRFSKAEEAQKAKDKLEGKLARGRRLIVGYAHQLDSVSDGKSKRPVLRSAQRDMTMLSLLKGANQSGSLHRRSKRRVTIIQ